MALVGTLAHVRKQLAHSEHFAASFVYVEECFHAGSAASRALAAVPAGQTERVDLAGGAFALLQAYLTKPRSEGRWETHRAHIDIQAVVTGNELMEIADRGRMVLDEDLTPAKDVIFYKPFEEGSVLRFGPGDTGIYFPTDAHRGSLVVTTPALVRKVVIKVPVGPFAG